MRITAEGEHWLAWLPDYFGPVLIDEANVQSYRDSGWRVVGPYVLKSSGHA